MGSEIKLLFFSNSYLYLLVYVLIPLAFLHGAKIHIKTFNINFLSAHFTTQYKGLCILIVIIHHIAQRMQQPALMRPFIYAGNP